MSLSQRGIRDLFGFDYSLNKTYFINYTFQITEIKKTETHQKTQNTIYTASLRDSEYFYNRFVFVAKPNDPIISVGLIITIYQISPMQLTSQPNRIFLVKEYSCTDLNSPIEKSIFYSPELEFEIQKKEQLNENNIEEEYSYLAELNTFTKLFSILIRVIAKNDIRTFQGKRSGKLFDFIVIDEKGTTMQIVCFDKIVDKFFSLIKENEVYLISNGCIKLKDQKFYKNLNCEYKLILNDSSKILLRKDDNKIKSNFNLKEITSISAIKNILTHSIINCIGIVKSFQNTIQLKTKNGEQEFKKAVIIDDSGEEIDITLWGKYAGVRFKKGDILFLQKMRVGVFNGKNIANSNETIIQVNPTTQPLKTKINDIKMYYSKHKEQFAESNNGNSNNTSQYKLNENISKEKKDFYIKENQICHYEPDFSFSFIEEVLQLIQQPNKVNDSFRIKVFITEINHLKRNYYPGCQKCQRKLSFQGKNNWYCLYCQVKCNFPTMFFSFPLKVKDCTHDYSFDLFGKLAENFLQISPNDYRKYIEDNNYDKLNRITNKIKYRSYYFFVKPKIQTFNGKTLKKLIVTNFENIDQGKETYRVLNKIKNILV